MPEEALVESLLHMSPQTPVGLLPGQRWIFCTYKDRDRPPVYLAVGGAPDVRGAVAAARGRVRVGVPGVHTAPPRGGLQLVGVDVWVWVDHAEPVSATASVPGASATVTAVPGAVHVDVDGRALTCPGGGTAWDPGRPGRGQHSDCTHRFEDAGTFPVRVTVDWSLRWTATDGQSGTLPTLRRTTTFELTVHQAHAVTD